MSPADKDVYDAGLVGTLKSIHDDLDAAGKKPKFPARLPEQVAVVRDLLAAETRVMTAEGVAKRFRQGKKVERKVLDVLRTLVALGQADRTESGYYLDG